MLGFAATFWHHMADNRYNLLVGLGLTFLKALVAEIPRRTHQFESGGKLRGRSAVSLAGQ